MYKKKISHTSQANVNRLSNSLLNYEVMEFRAIRLYNNSAMLEHYC